jgi:arylamine N-acetyltransferase
MDEQKTGKWNGRGNWSLDKTSSVVYFWTPDPAVFSQILDADRQSCGKKRVAVVSSDLTIRLRNSTIAEKSRQKEEAFSRVWRKREKLLFRLRVGGVYKHIDICRILFGWVLFLYI